MHPIALILAALAAGAEDTAEAPVRDAHAALMAQLRMRLADCADGEAGDRRQLAQLADYRAPLTHRTRPLGSVRRL
jgi:hypothetical protein